MLPIAAMEAAPNVRSDGFVNGDGASAALAAAGGSGVGADDRGVVGAEDGEC